MIPIAWCDRCNQPADDPFFHTTGYGDLCEQCAMQLVHVLSRESKPVKHLALRWSKCSACVEALAEKKREWDRDHAEHQ